jgi:hypothetical protein
LCPESEWSSYFVDYWKGYFKETVYEFKHGFLDMPKLEGDKESSIAKTWHEEQCHYFDDQVFDDPVDTNYEFLDSDMETEASINLDYH